MADIVTASNLVVLIPGFLGFDRIGDFEYFHAAVGDVLGRALPSGITVARVTTDPAADLARRQAILITQLETMLQNRPGVRLHLVGHSTGGLDAELLLSTPLFSGYAADKLLESIASVTTIAAPLTGTSVSDAAISKVFSARRPQDLLVALRGMLLKTPALALRFGADLFALIGNDRAVSSLVHGVLWDGPAAATFLLELILRRSLAVDLSPSEVAEVWAQRQPNPACAHVPRARFVTLARVKDRPTPAGRLFQRFYDATYNAATRDPGTDSVAQELVARSNSKIPVIGQPPQPLLIDYRSNDGIVNTARQLLPTHIAPQDVELTRVKALVIADHIDVIGYFEGANGAENGFLSSGSNFRTAEFEALYRAVARHIAGAL